ncbi:hypothetical protein VPHD81_0003 [Vibrio phage D81]
MARQKITRRDTQILAMSLFGRGSDEAVFRTPSRITPRAKASLDDLVNMGAVTFQTSGSAHVYKGNKSVLGVPMRDYAAIRESEDFPIVK